MNFDGGVYDAEFWRDARFVVDRARGGFCDDGKHSAVDAWSDRPHVQVGDFFVLSFYRFVKSFNGRFGGLVIQQGVAAGADEADGPVGDEKGSDDTHNGIHPDVSKVFGGEEREDGGDGSEGVGHDMQVG